MTFDGYAVEVLGASDRGFGRYFVARCAMGHSWHVGHDVIENIREKLSLVSWDYKADRWLRDQPQILTCPECAVVARVALVAVFDDPDYLRIPGHAE
jgi:hypothetical protein